LFKIIAIRKTLKWFQPNNLNLVFRWIRDRLCIVWKATPRETRILHQKRRA
jgi:hypothetical protein